MRSRSRRTGWKQSRDCCEAQIQVALGPFQRFDAAATLSCYSYTLIHLRIKSENARVPNTDKIYHRRRTAFPRGNFIILHRNSMELEGIPCRGGIFLLKSPLTHAFPIPHGRTMSRKEVDRGGFDVDQ